ncbi:MAG: pilus assembly PilX family protein [Pyrinomonadaceae bacterium]
MDQSQSTPNQSRKANERGAALVISLLIATVLLVAGGALIQVTSMSAANAIDSTAETQAYYGAEAGLQAALNALRGNTAPSASAMPALMTRITFRNAVAPASSNDCPGGLGGDPSTVARLSRWLPYTNRQAAGTRVTVGTNPTISYDVVVSLPPGDIMPVNPVVQPSRLLVQATGYGPSGARKQMSMIVASSAFDPTVPAMMTLIGAPGGTPAMSFESGSSAGHNYSSVDNDTDLPTGMPAFGVTNAGDALIATTQAASNTTSTPAAGVLTSASLPDFLRSTAEARNFLNEMQAAAKVGANFYPTTPLPPATATYCKPPDPCIGKYASAAQGNTPIGFTFVEGDYVMDSGASSGILIVTGELTTTGGTSFDGLLYVIGAGYVNRNGGGGGAFYGANFIARVPNWPLPPDVTPSNSFGAPFFQFNGAGGATMQYDSGAVANALRLLPLPVLGVSEY